MDLASSQEQFHHEIYTSATASTTLTYRALVTQRAEIATDAKTSDNTAGADAALANLKQSLASFAQEKEAKK